ncbi:MAG: ABC transporter ATP-binding protein [Peptococcaceae bacterium]|nr:ABC transporter ATP-binding protein [Peptococcaceae bacterium]
MSFSILAVLKKYLMPRKGRLLLVGSLMLLALAMQLVRPLILRHILDEAISGEGMAVLQLGALLLAVVSVLGHVFGTMTRYMSDVLGWEATNELRDDVTKHVLRLDQAFHKGTRPGELIERVDVDVTRLANFFANFTRHIVINVLFLLGSIVLLWREHMWVGASYAAYSVLSIGALSYLRRLVTPYQVAERKASAQVYGFLGEQLAVTEDMQGLGAQSYMLEKLRAEFQKWLPHRIRTFVSYNTLWSSAILAHVVNISLAVGLAAMLWQRGLITLGTVFLIVHYAELLQVPIEQIRMQLQELQRAAASLRRVTELFNTKAISQQSTGHHIPEGPIRVVAEGLGFKYEDGGAVLDGVSFALPAGEVLGIIGRTGSGKTTLARLVARQYDPSFGVLALSGVPTTAATQATIRERVSFVGQEVQIFHATVRDNLTFFGTSTNDAELIGVLYDLGLGEWFAALPDGLGTMMSHGGSGLSAGEAQLLALARAFLRNPSLVVLDEASAKIDPISEKRIDTALEKLLAGRTGIIIAHRLTTLDRVDHILLLDEGKVVEYGRQQELLNSSTSRYAGLRRLGVEEVLA